MILTGMLGDQAENLAYRFLKKQGLSLHQKNYRCRFGEIDIDMQDSDYLVFVEVRHRKSNNFGGVPAYFTKSKDSKSMGIEHTHPPSEYIFLGDRNHFQKLKKKYWIYGKSI